MRTFNFVHAHLIELLDSISFQALALLKSFYRT